MVNINKDFWKNKKVIITGHTGFKGSWLLIWLIKLGAKVYGISISDGIEHNLFNSIKRKLSNKFVHKLIDIRDLGKVSSAISEIKPDVIIHMAAQALVQESYKDPIKTWSTNLMGTINLLECTSKIKNPCSFVCVTTDKVYENKNWCYGYRENDNLGGIDPYSASKAAAEIAIKSWRKSFCGENNFEISKLGIASARAGNVIGGGDFAENRLIPDCFRAYVKNNSIKVRNPNSIRPWQFVLEPLYGYLLLAERLYQNPKIYSSEYNFGPNNESNKTVLEVVEHISSYWNVSYIIQHERDLFHEATILNLDISKAKKSLQWEPVWGFEESIKKTTQWYKNIKSGYDPYTECLNNIKSFETEN
mgnify:CR=1 FL=1|tara:strand:+ start:996 stop:2078 length:1083 start_codon:yes stop_codon:yes gene_type:complete